MRLPWGDATRRTPATDLAVLPWVTLTHSDLIRFLDCNCLPGQAKVFEQFGGGSAQWLLPYGRSPNSQNICVAMMFVTRRFVWTSRRDRVDHPDTREWGAEFALRRGCKSSKHAGTLDTDSHDTVFYQGVYRKMDNFIFPYTLASMFDMRYYRLRDYKTNRTKTSTLKELLLKSTI